MSEWLSGLAFYELGLLWLLATLVVGSFVGGIMRFGNPTDEAEERRGGGR